MGKYRRIAESRFHTLYEVNLDNGCWEWISSRNVSGYGTIGVEGKSLLAHRFSWMIRHGVEIAPNQYVCHICDNPPCVNPDHLFLGSHADNMADASKKKRTRGPNFRGEDHGMAVLTENDVRAIRALNGIRVSYAQMARWYGVTEGNIKFIVYRQTWKEVPDRIIIDFNPLERHEKLLARSEAENYGRDVAVCSRQLGRSDQEESGAR